MKQAPELDDVGSTRTNAYCLWNIVEPLMPKGVVRCEPLCRVKVCQASDEILEVRVKGLHVPEGEWFSGILFIKTVSKCFQHLAPRTVAEVLQ